MAVLIARLGTSVMGGHQIISNLAAVAYQIPLALSLATATVTAQAHRRGRRGAGAPDRVHRHPHRRDGGVPDGPHAAGCFRRGIVGLYTNDAAVAGVALSLIGYLVAFHVFDALQGITAFVLRAYRIAVVPMLIYAVALWGLGLIGGYFVAFHPVLGGPRGASGMWLMQTVALCLTSLLLLGFYLWVLRQQRAAVGAAAR